MGIAGDDLAQPPSDQAQRQSAIDHGLGIDLDQSPKLHPIGQEPGVLGHIAIPLRMSDQGDDPPLSQV